MATELQQYESNKNLVRSEYERLWNDGDYDFIEETCADSFVGHDPTADEMDREAFEEFARNVRAGFPDVHFEVEDLVAEGDMVVSRYVGTGTHDGEFMGIAPTGREVTVSGITVYRLEDGKIAETWANWDAFGMLAQLGLLPDEITA